jgi:transposase-like protein
VVVTTSAPNENDHRDRREAGPTLSEIKSLLASDKDFLKPIVRAVLQEVLGGEMMEAHGAAEGEREGDFRYRPGVLHALPSDRDWQVRVQGTAGPARQR